MFQLIMVKLQNSLKKREPGKQSVLKFYRKSIPFQFAVTIGVNVGSYTQGRIVPIYRDQTEKQFERKDAHRKPLLPHLTGS